MSTIYKGIAEIGGPQRTDYFAGVRESLEKIQSEKEKKNQDRLDALSKIPLENESKMWGEDLGVLRKMHEDLREGLEEASKSPEAMAAWERDLEYANKYQTVSEEQYAVTAPEALRNAEIAKNPSMNPYSKDGARDSRSSDYYTEEIKNHDNENRFESIKKAPGEGWEMSSGQPITDHFLTEEKKRWSQPDLELMDAASPDGWWPSRVGTATTDTPEEALSRAKGMIERSESDTNNAIVWYSQTANEGKGMPIENVDEKIAIDAYAKEAAKGRIKAKEKKSTLEKNQGAKLESLVDGIKKDLGLRLPSIPAPDDIGTFSEGSVSASYAALTGKKIYVGGNFDEDAVEGDEGNKYEVSGVYLTDEGTPVFQLRTSKGDTTVESGFDDDLYKQIESQMDAEYGQGSLLKLLQKM